MLYEQEGYLPLKYKSISFELHIDTNVIQSIVNNFGLFENDTEKFWSKSVLERLEKRKDISEKRKDAIANRWKSTSEYKCNTNVIQNDTNINKKENKS